MSAGTKHLGKTPSIADILLLTLLCITIFLVPFFPRASHQRIYDFLFTGTFITSAFALERDRKRYLTLALAVTIIEWLSSLLGLLIATAIARGLAILFFVLIVIALIVQIARTRYVTTAVVVDSINGYLLLGVVFTLMVGLLMLYRPDAYNMPGIKFGARHQGSTLSEYFYYTFVTFATLGYGDIVPKLPVAKSLATLIAVVGQLYVAILIAMLIGKYVSSAPGAGNRTAE
jgi:Ion channel